MNDTTNKTQVEIARISQELDKLNKDLQRERTDRKAEEQRQQKQLEEIVSIIMDYDRASTRVIHYFIKLDARYNNLILALQDAVIAFNDFLRLPPSSNNLSRYWDVAWAALATVLPLLRVSATWVQLEKTAEAELKTANYVLQDTSLQTKLFTYTSRGHNIADWMNKENTLAARMRDVETKKPKADMVRTPIRAMMDESNLAHKALDHVVEALWAEYKARLTYAITSTPFARKETLEKMADRLLPQLNYVEQDEAEQVKRSYLYQICKAWAPQNVAIVTTVYHTGDSVHIEGLNDTQQDQIMAWFGPGSNWVGGTVPLLPTIWYYLALWNVPKKREGSTGLIFGSG
jgi:hypothetical protein